MISAMTERLLKLVGPIHLVGGLLLAMTGFVPAASAFLESVFPAAEHIEWSPYFVAVLGPTIASWGLLFGVLVNQYLAVPSVRIWRGLMLSLLVWAPLDTALCVVYQFYSGAIINMIVLVIIGGLLLAVRDRIR